MFITNQVILYYTNIFHFLEAQHYANDNEQVCKKNTRTEILNQTKCNV
jgi:hypothetical protein